MSSKASVVIVGRMNVGKSTLFNRISVRIKSITLDYEGVTRDYIKEEVEWKGRPFDLIDSGGIHLRKSNDPLFEKVRKKVLALVEDADVIVFMVDGTVGLIPEDREIATYLHKVGKPVVLAINIICSENASRVVPATSETNARSSCNSAFISEDLPTLGLPRSITLNEGSTLAAWETCSGTRLRTASKRSSTPLPCSADNSIERSKSSCSNS